MTNKKLSTEIDEKQVVDFLRCNSNFFNEHPKLLCDLSLPYKDGKVISLAQKQTECLRKEFGLLQRKVLRLERKIGTLVNIVRENERLSVGLHCLSLKLLHKREIEALVAETLKTLREQFPANQIAMRLLSPYCELSRTTQSLDENDPILKTFLASLFQFDRPDCGPFGGAIQKALFGHFAQRICSAVVMPLQFNDQRLGILLFGSPRAEAFAPEKSTTILVQFGKLIAAALTAAYTSR